MKIVPDKSADFQILTNPPGYENQNAALIPLWKKEMILERSREAVTQQQ
jgi:hypothetical protein